MCSGYALAFYDAVVPSDAALVCTMFDQFPRSYGRKMQPIHAIFAKKYKKKHQKKFAHFKINLYLCTAKVLQTNIN